VQDRDFNRYLNAVRAADRGLGRLRILFAVFTDENKSQGVSTPFLLTQNN
jgi:hypothetical protein